MTCRELKMFFLQLKIKMWHLLSMLEDRYV